jgi:SAM-dependent methyltransferase
MLHRFRVTLKRRVPERAHGLLKAAILRPAALALRGDCVECPCCERRYRRFLDYPSRFCPGCSSFERHRFLCLYLGKHPELLADRRSVLHVSPEPCLTRLLRSAGLTDYLSIDLDYRLAMRRMDVTDLQLESERFDLVVCSHVLDAVAELGRALGELRRVLRPGGLALFQTPAIPRDAPPRFEESLRAAGFEVETVVARELGDAAGARHGIDADEHLYLARPALTAGA